MCSYQSRVVLDTYSTYMSGHMYIYVLEAMRPFVLVIHFSRTYTGHTMYYMHVVAVSSDCIKGPRRYACSIAIHHCPTKVLHMPFVFTPAAYPHSDLVYRISFGNTVVPCSYAILDLVHVGMHAP